MRLEGAVMGLGNIGFGFNFDEKRKGVWTHVRAFEKSGMISLTGAVDPSADARARFASRYPNVPVYDSAEALFRNHKPDVVSICTPTSSHYPLAELAAGAGVRGLFCEKPLASSAHDARALCELCRERDIALAVNHTRRWDWRYRRVADAVQSGFLGEVKYVVALYSGNIFNIGTHLVDTVQMITGQRFEMASGFDVGGDPNPADPHISGILPMSGGVLCHVSCHGVREALIFEIDVVGTKGRVRITENGEKSEFFSLQESRRYSGYSELEKVRLPAVAAKPDRFVAAVKNLCRVMQKEGGPILCSGEDGYYAVAAVEAMHESSASGGQYVAIPSL